MIANLMVGLLGHSVNVLPASSGYKMYHGSELICILSNGTSMFQVPMATQNYARIRLSGLQYALVRLFTKSIILTIGVGRKYMDDN